MVTFSLFRLYLEANITSLDMMFKKLHLGTISFTPDTLSDIQGHLATYYNTDSPIFVPPKKGKKDHVGSTARTVRDAIAALALCHNVTPVVDGENITYRYTLAFYTLPLITLVIKLHHPMRLRS